MIKWMYKWKIKWMYLKVVFCHKANFGGLWLIPKSGQIYTEIKYLSSLSLGFYIYTIKR
jgi:hypothetical protein